MIINNPISINITFFHGEKCNDVAACHDYDTPKNEISVTERKKEYFSKEVFLFLSEWKKKQPSHRLQS
jgi:hypothetical protein